MEIINDNKISDQRGHRRRGRGNHKVEGHLFIGLLLIVVGLLWLLRNFYLLPDRMFDTLFTWQMLMVVTGGYLIVTRRYMAGLIVGGLGFLFAMADIFDVPVSMSKVAMPVIIVAIGIAITLTKLGRK